MKLYEYMPKAYPLSHEEHDVNDESCALTFRKCQVYVCLRVHFLVRFFEASYLDFIKSPFRFIKCSYSLWIQN